jgi:hypothetical protein
MVDAMQMDDKDWERVLKLEKRNAFVRGFLHAYVVFATRDEHPGWYLTLHDRFMHLAESAEEEAKRNND